MVSAFARLGPPNPGLDIYFLHWNDFLQIFSTFGHAVFEIHDRDTYGFQQDCRALQYACALIQIKYPVIQFHREGVTKLFRQSEMNKTFILSYSSYMKENAICGICAISIFSKKNRLFLLSITNNHKKLAIFSCFKFLKIHKS